MGVSARRNAKMRGYFLNNHLERHVFITDAIAQTTAAGPGGLMGNLTSFLPIILMIRPQMKRQKEQKAMMEALAKGDEVVTSGGLLGKIVKVSDAYITVEVSEGNEIVVQKAAITTLLPKGTLKGL